MITMKKLPLHLIVPALLAQLTLLHAAEKPEQKPAIIQIGAVAKNILALTIQDREVMRRGQQPYVAMEGDEVRQNEKGNTPQWNSAGEVVLGSKDIVLWRRIGGELRQYAWYVTPPAGPLIWREEISGIPLDKRAVDDPAAYSISSGDDPAFDAAGTLPVAVYRKSKPNDLQHAPGAKDNLSYRHVIFIVLPFPLSEGKSYNINLHGINTRQKSVAYRHDSRKNASEAIHTTHIGYRPDDPFKRAYLSVWLGTGGAHAYEGVNGFELIDAKSGETVYTGDVVLGFPADRDEQMQVVKNHNKTNVYYMDFHDFNRPGTYMVRVPGIGLGLPFTIGREVWTDAFRKSMHGLLCHRSGIELGAPFTDYQRPRNMHPADGFKVFNMKHTVLEGEIAAVVKDFTGRLGNPPDIKRLGAPNPNAWGGYMDAGDWDRRSPQHLFVSQLLLELFELFPTHFSQVKIALPPDEAGNGLPGILNEALFNIDCYRRMQERDGGVRGGIESTMHPRRGEASWQESLLVGAFAPDPVVSYSYAAAAARAARLLAGLDDRRADKLAESAVRAWNWAEANEERVFNEIARRSPERKVGKWQRDQERLPALVELSRLTGEKEYREKLQSAFDQLDQNYIGSRNQLSAVFSAASDDTGRIEENIRGLAKSIIIHRANGVVDIGGGNAFSIHNMHLRYSLPETCDGSILPRAYVLTGDEKYLRAAVAAANFAAGANPENMTYVAGLGHKYPRSILHVDSRVTGQAPPVGTGVYGPLDLSVYKRGGMVPDSRSWPTTESHIDMYVWPIMNEYTVQQIIGPTAYYWGFLSARE